MGVQRPGLRFNSSKKKKKPQQAPQELFQNNKLNQMKKHIMNDEKQSEAGLKLEMQQKMDNILNQVKTFGQGTQSTSALGGVLGQRKTTMSGLPPLPKSTLANKYSSTTHLGAIKKTPDLGILKLKDSDLKTKIIAEVKPFMTKQTYSSSLKHESGLRKA